MSKRYHEEAQRLLKEEWDRLDRELRTIKGRVAKASQSDPYGSGGDKAHLMQEEHRLRRQFKSIDLSLKVLRKDGQARHQYDWEMEQAEIRRKQEGSSNCLGGC